MMITKLSLKNWYFNKYSMFITILYLTGYIYYLEDSRDRIKDEKRLWSTATGC